MSLNQLIQQHNDTVATINESVANVNASAQRAQQLSEMGLSFWLPVLTKSLTCSAVLLTILVCLI